MDEGKGRGEGTRGLGQGEWMRRRDEGRDEGRDERKGQGEVTRGREAGKGWGEYMRGGVMGRN